MAPKDRHANLSELSAFVLLALIIFLIYANTFHATWHLDDYDSIIGNQRIHATADRPESMLTPFRSLFSGDRVARPLSFSTFALNWYFGQDNPAGYHLLNILIHVASAFILFLTLMALLETPRLSGMLNRSQIYFVSLLAAVLWAINPIQVQSITYIVQRMASLCGLFYLMGIYFYIRARSNGPSRHQFIFFGACLISFLLALLTKENAATLPLALVLVEATFFQRFSVGRIRPKIFLVASAATLLVFAGLVLLFLNIDLSNLLSVYDKRYFQLSERLLTQPRILLFYLTLIFYPTPDRLSLVHDIEVSTSLWAPWTTLTSLLAVFGMIGLALLNLRKWPVISFASLFYFLTHMIESSFIPLEMVFEHRNYLPSMFLFLPVAMGLNQLLSRYRGKSHWMYCLLVAFIPLLIIGLGTGTYIRNLAWSTEKSLWEDSLRKAPESARPYINLAWSHFERRGDRPTALVFYHQALNKRYNRKSQYAKVFNNIANIYYQSGDCRRASEYWRKSKDVSSSFYMPRYRLAMSLTRCGQLDEALVHIDDALQLKPDSVKALKLKGCIRLLQNQPRDALALFRLSVRNEPGEASHFINIGAAYVVLRDHRKAKLFLDQALRVSGREPIALLWSTVNFLRMHDAENANALLDELSAKLTLDELTLWLKKGVEARVYNGDIVFPDVDDELVRRLVSRYEKKLPLLEKRSG